MLSTSDIASTLGKARIAREVGRTPQAVTNAIVRGHFPASWRPVIERLARKEGIRVTDEHFYSVTRQGSAA